MTSADTLPTHDSAEECQHGMLRLFVWLVVTEHRSTALNMVFAEWKIAIGESRLKRSQIDVLQKGLQARSSKKRKSAADRQAIGDLARQIEAAQQILQRLSATEKISVEELRRLRRK
ncbi:hypothetical protein MPER_14858, partial [Moniliophthora perniciosa FA553]